MSARRRHVRVACLALVLAALALPARAQAPPDLDAFVASVMKAFEVPGVGLAIVKDGQVVVAKGYGVRRMGEPAPVDEHTLFAVASNTKVFTATALGLLVEEGTVEWNAPVVRYLPWFQMWDPWVTRQLTVRDLLVHRSGLGLGAGDLLWWPPSTYQRREIARRLRLIEPATSFRSAYAYDNVLYLVAGEVIEAVSGRTWEQFVSERILRKVGMADSRARYAPAANGGNTAGPHGRIEGTVRPIKPFASDNTNPAGGINASAADMARWVTVLLAGGRLPDGSRLFSEQTSRTLQTLVTPMPIGDPAPELAAQRMNFRGYALGLNVHDYRGRKIVTHTGGLPGFVSKVTMVPEIGLGVVVLTNQESGEAFSALSYHVLDHYLGADDTDWLDAYVKVRARSAQRVADAESKTAAERNAASRPSLPLAGYAATYADAWYGDIDITEENGRLVMRFSRTPALVGDLEHWQYDTFLVKWRDRELRADAFVTFALDAEGRVERATMKPASPSVDFSFDFQDVRLRPRR